MRLIFLEFEKAGVGRDAMAESLREMKLTPGMEGLWEFIRQNKRKLKVRRIYHLVSNLNQILGFVMLIESEDCLC